MTDQNRKWVRWFVDYAPLVAFFVAFFATGRNLQHATWGLVIGSALALIVGFAVEKRLAPFPLIAGGAALLFGGLTLMFHDERFLKVKPTVMNGAFAAALVIGLALKKNPLKLVMGEALDMPDAVWRRLTINYALFFLALAGLNEFVWRTQSDATWVVFRFPGLMILTLIFSFAHVPLLMKYMKAEDLPPPPTE